MKPHRILALLILALPLVLQAQSQFPNRPGLGWGSNRPGADFYVTARNVDTTGSASLNAVTGEDSMSMRMWDDSATLRTTQPLYINGILWPPSSGSGSNWFSANQTQTAGRAHNLGGFGTQLTNGAAWYQEATDYRIYPESFEVWFGETFPQLSHEEGVFEGLFSTDPATISRVYFSPTSLRLQGVQGSNSDTTGGIEVNRENVRIIGARAVELDTQYMKLLVRYNPTGVPGAFTSVVRTISWPDAVALFGQGGAGCTSDSLYGVQVGNYTGIVYRRCDGSTDTVLLASDQALEVAAEATAAGDTVTATWFSYTPVDLSAAGTIVAPPGGTPQGGDWFAVADSRSNAATNNATINFSDAGLRFYGAQATDDTIDTDGAVVRYIYVDSNVGFVREGP